MFKVFLCEHSTSTVLPHYETSGEFRNTDHVNTLWVQITTVCAQYCFTLLGVWTHIQHWFYTMRHTIGNQIVCRPQCRHIWISNLVHIFPFAICATCMTHCGKNLFVQRSVATQEILISFHVNKSLFFTSFSHPLTLVSILSGYVSAWQKSNKIKNL